MWNRYQVDSLHAYGDYDEASMLSLIHIQAESIVNSSRKSADELAENTKSELKLFAGQAVNALKSEVATTVSYTHLQLLQNNNF